jgi:hypothetical protein
MTRPTAAQLDAMIDDLTVDAYGDDEQLSGFLVGADEALVPGERASIVGVDVEILAVDAGPDERTGLLAGVRRDGQAYEVTLADLSFPAQSALGLVAVYRRRQGRR